MFRFFAKFAAFAVAFLLISTPAAFAEKNPPKGSTPTDPQEIARLFNGKTSFWNSGGSAYWGPGGVFESTGRKGEDYGKGKWYITTSGKLCQEATYYWMESNTVKNDDWKGCWEFQTAPDGVVWERFLPDKTEWYRHNAGKQKNGNANAKAFKANGAKLGF